MNKNTWKGYLFVIASAVIYGCMPLMASHIYADGVTSLTLVFLRNLLSLPVLAVLAYSQNKKLAVPAAALPHISLLAIFGCCVTPMLLFSAYRHIASGTATVFHFIYPAVVVLAEWALFKVKISAKNLLSVALCLGGIAMFYTPGQPLNPTGSLFALTSGVTYSAYILCLSRFRYRDISGFLLSFYVAAVSSCIMLPVCLVSGRLSLPTNMGTWLLCAFFAAIVTAGASVLFQQGTFLIGGQKASVLSAMEPITGVVVGALLLNETVSPAVALGSAMVILASILIAKKDKQKEA